MIDIGVKYVRHKITKVTERVSKQETVFTANAESKGKVKQVWLFPPFAWVAAIGTEIFQGSVAQARKLKNITELCKTCTSRIVKEKGLDEPETQSKDE